LERLEAVGGRTELRDAPGVALSPCHAGQLGKELVEDGGPFASARSTNVFFLSIRRNIHREARQVVVTPCDHRVVNEMLLE
jgi:hypothetical protein